MAKASERSWAGYPPETRVCPLCGERVTLTGAGGGFRAHTDVVSGERWVAHTECLRVVSS